MIGSAQLRESLAAASSAWRDTRAGLPARTRIALVGWATKARAAASASDSSPGSSTVETPPRRFCTTWANSCAIDQRPDTVPGA
jgi:hypothetical protein